MIKNENELIAAIKSKFPNRIQYQEVGYYGPFGANGGLFVFYKFCEWRKLNIKYEPINFLEEIGYPYLDWNETEAEKVQKYIDNTTNSILDVFTEDIFKSLFDNIKNTHKEQYGFDIPIDDTIDRKNSTSDTACSFIIEQDTAMVSVAFGQYLLEDKVCSNLLEKALIAIQRQTLPVILNTYKDGFEKRLFELSCIKQDLNTILQAAI
jgi:uncharacterized protein YfeS